ncbi:MAG: hypothetical protein ACP5I3_04525 [Thermoproteus sp.]
MRAFDRVLGLSAVRPIDVETIEVAESLATGYRLMPDDAVVAALALQERAPSLYL